MNYDLFTQSFPTLEGKTVRMREIRGTDIPALLELLQQSKVVQNFSSGQFFQTKEQVEFAYITHSKILYQSKEKIQWVLEQKSTGTIMGLREFFVDSPTKLVTVQGFVGERFQNWGYSKEAYSLLIDYASQKGAIGLLANTSVENFPAVALLFSAGFKPNYAQFYQGELRLIFRNDLTFDIPYTFDNFNLKRLYIFCKMYLHATDINITENGSWRRNGALQQSYRVLLTARNTLAPRANEEFQLKFLSDGIGVRTVDDKDPSSADLNGRTAYLNAWGLCWELCKVNRT